jgi:hypothetical protein
MACANYWTTPFQVGSHHLARGFVDAGWTVGFVSDPISPLHLLGPARKELASRFRLHRQGGVWDLGKKLWAYVPAALATPRNEPLLRSHALERGWAHLTWPSVGGGWCGTTASAMSISCTAIAPSICPGSLRSPVREPCFEWPTTPPGSDARRPPPGQPSVNWLPPPTLVVYSAETLKEYVEGLKPRRMAHLPNGVNFSHFARPDVPVPSEYASIRRPIAVYAGYMDAWFDYALLGRVVAALPDVSFVLIGGTPMPMPG